MCTSAFLNKKYNDRILQYLSDFYSGPVETMLRLWRAAQDFELRTRDLEERILSRQLEDAGCHVIYGLDGLHRLDRPVGGVMVFAKTSKAASRLSEEVREKIFQKTYLVIANGKFEEEKRNI